MKFTLIVSTLGRTEELKTLFRSLQDQTYRDFEVIVSDQNSDDRLVKLLATTSTDFPIRRVESRGGSSRGRNDGMAAATGEILGFPDDDCAFTPRLLEDVADFFDSRREYGYLSGRSFGDDGRDSVSRHARRAGDIARDTVHSQCIEFAIFVRRSALGAIRFDEQMGPGAPTPWHCDEGPDLFLRMNEQGVRGYYDPRFAVWHPRPVGQYGAREIERTFRYACGNGYFYRKHGYSGAYFARQMVRTACGLVLAILSFSPNKARLYAARLRGRWKGWRAPRPEKTAARSVLETGNSLP